MKKIILITIVLVISMIGCLDNKKEYLDQFKFEKLTKNVYVMHGPLDEPTKENKGFMNNPAVIIGSNSVTTIDPGGTQFAGELVLRELKKITSKPIEVVLNTHIHGDHWLANETIAKKYPKVKIYAHPKMIARAKSGRGEFWTKLMIKLTKGEATGLKPFYPTNATKNEEIIKVDSESFKIHNNLNEKAHTNTDIMIEHIQSKTLFLGDNDFVNRMGRFDNTSSMHGTIDILEYVKTLNLTFFVPGHGKSGNFENAVAPYLKYLEILKDVVQTGFDNDLESYEIKDDAIKKLEDYKTWVGFEHNIGVHVIKMYSEIEEKALEE